LGPEAWFYAFGLVLYGIDRRCFALLKKRSSFFFALKKTLEDLLLRLFGSGSRSFGVMRFTVKRIKKLIFIDVGQKFSVTSCRII